MASLLITNCWLLACYSFFVSFHHAFERPFRYSRIKNFAAQGNVHAVLHNGTIFDFTTEALRQAFDIQQSRHAHGKI